MAIINGATPQADHAPSRIRVVIKLAMAAQESSRSEKFAVDDRIQAELERLAPGTDITRYFEEGKQTRAANLEPFNRYLAIDMPNREDAAILARKLRESDLIEEAYVEGGPVPPPVNPDDDPRSANQGYLGAAPAGIDARWTWPLTDGSGIRFVDLEQGWTLNHEDLVTAGITIISGQSRDYHGHGTAVLGEVLASDNARGGIGIAPGVTAQVVSQWRDTTTYNTAAAILSAVGAMNAGDVLLLEAQTDFNGVSLLPVEVEPATFDAIRYAVNQGIVVIEAAGNGSNDLDAYNDANNRSILKRSSKDFQDSGAIMVGAATSAVPHSRMNFSNFGSRIDCFAWGEDIDTTGDGWKGTSTSDYTNAFGGTSGASPMVAGAAILLQSWRRTKHGQVFNPGTVRALLSSDKLNTPSANPASDRIGVMPNLRAIVTTEELQATNENYLAWVYILFGLLDDSPGVIWIPGRGPVPVDPGWVSIAQKLSAPKRDLLAILAVNEMINLIDDQASRTALAGTTVAAMRAAVEQIARASDRTR